MSNTISRTRTSGPDHANTHGALPARLLDAATSRRRGRLGPLELEFKLVAADGVGFSLIEWHVDEAFEAPPILHWHTREAAVFHVLEGEVGFELAQGARSVGPGETLILPAGAPFNWSTQDPAHFLTMYRPAGFERYFMDVMDAAAAVGGPPAAVMERVIPPLWKKYGIKTE